MRSLNSYPASLTVIGLSLLPSSEQDSRQRTIKSKHSKASLARLIMRIHFFDKGVYNKGVLYKKWDLPVLQHQRRVMIFEWIFSVVQIFNRFVQAKKKINQSSAMKFFSPSGIWHQSVHCFFKKNITSTTELYSNNNNNKSKKWCHS